jgi:RimJ/RimL family protein N-acetyltransferase
VICNRCDVVRVIPAVLPLVEAALTSDAALADAAGCGVEPGWATFVGALEATRDALVADPSSVEWGPRLFIGEDPPRIVGWGGFKGRPDDGVVELGYEIAESVRGRGLATAAAEAMLAEAFAHDDVTAVIAHTLPEPNTSNHILERLGFQHDGVRIEGHEEVWRFVRHREEVRR